MKGKSPARRYHVDIKVSTEGNSDYQASSVQFTVIRGSYGNGGVRKQKLGEQYLEVQNRVNEIYREKGLL